MISALWRTNEMTNGPKDWNRGPIEAPSKEDHRVIIQANKGRSQQDYRVSRAASHPVSLLPDTLFARNYRAKLLSPWHPPLSPTASRQKMPPASLSLSLSAPFHLTLFLLLCLDSASSLFFLFFSLSTSPFASLRSSIRQRSMLVEGCSIVDDYSSEISGEQLRVSSFSSRGEKCHGASQYSGGD